MDVHQASRAVASVAQDSGAAVSSLGTVGPRPCDSATRSRQWPSTRKHRVLVSAAGPCGSWLSRYLPHKGHGGWGVAPAVMPQKSGDRGKTDRRAARQLARRRRSGDLTPVSGPAVQDAAMRERSRAREETLHALQTATFRLNAWRRRPAIRSTGRATWGPAHLRWLREVVCPTPAPHIVFPAEGRAVTAPTDRLQRLDPALHAQVPAWRLCPGVAAWHARRGVQFPGAVTPVAARGDLTRCAHPRQLLHSLGLTPSE